MQDRAPGHAPKETIKEKQIVVEWPSYYSPDVIGIVRCIAI